MSGTPYRPTLAELSTVTAVSSDKERGSRSVSTESTLISASPIAIPLDFSTFHSFESCADVSRYMDAVRNNTIPVQFEYGRYGNTTLAAVEQLLIHKERPATKRSGNPTNTQAVLVSDGMRAVSITLTVLAQRALAAGKPILLTTADMYKKTRVFLDQLCCRGKLAVRVVDHSIIDREQLDDIGAIFVEVPSNPYLRVANIPVIARRASEHQIPLAVDTTFASPSNLRPLELGATAVVHSVTKYLSGHNSLMGGAIIGDDIFIAAARAIVSVEGGVLDPGAAWRLSESIQTLDLRVAEQNRRALALAESLESNPAIARVWYPLLASHPDYSIAREILSGGGAVVSIEICGGRAAAERFVDSLQHWKIAASFGGSTSLAQPVVLMSYSAYSPQELVAIGIREGLVRLSVGIMEDFEVLKQDITSSLQALI
jgi:cystathionine gamma-synthase